MSPFWQTIITTVVVPAITQILKAWVERHRGKDLSVASKVSLPVMIGGVLQLGLAAATGGDVAQGLGLGVLAGGLASSARDFVHKGIRSKPKSCNCESSGEGC